MIGASARDWPNAWARARGGVVRLRSSAPYRSGSPRARRESAICAACTPCWRSGVVAEFGLMQPEHASSPQHCLTHVATRCVPASSCEVAIPFLHRDR